MFIKVLTLFIALAVTRRGQSEDSTTSTTSISCLVIGDWGKGGESGSTQSRSADPPPGHSSDTFLSSLSSKGKQISLESDNKRENRNLKKDEALNQVAVATAMAREVDRLVDKPSFVIAVGDNFYTKGILLCPTLESTFVLLPIIICLSI